MAEEIPQVNPRGDSNEIAARSCRSAQAMSLIKANLRSADQCGGGKRNVLSRQKICFAYANRCRNAPITQRNVHVPGGGLRGPPPFISQPE